MEDAGSPAAFIDKWRASWPEWRIAIAFLPADGRDVAQAWLALRHELAEAAWGGSDPAPGQAKLGWWQEELVGWQRGARRHPLGAALQKMPAAWDGLAAALPSLRASRVPEGDQGAAIAGLRPFGAAVATVAARLDTTLPQPADADAQARALLVEWVLRVPRRGVPADGTDSSDVLALPAPGGGARVERIQAAIVHGRLARLARGQRDPVLRGPSALLAAWRAARR